MTPLKLIFMGTPAFALPTLQALVESRHEVVAVYTQPPRPAGRGQKEKLSPVHAYALSKNIPIYTPVSLKDAQMQQQFRDQKADAAIVAAYGLLLPPAILEGTRMGCINVHPSLLPRWRGAAPIQRTIMAGDTETGIVIMQMNAGLDTGDMLLVKHFDITDGTTAGQLHDQLAAQAGPMVLEMLEGNMKPVRQPEAGVTYAKKITKEECRIDWRQSAHTIRQKILGLSPQPGAYFIYKGESIKILDAKAFPPPTPPASGGRDREACPSPSRLREGLGEGKAPGTILDNRLTIACGQNALIPTLLQRPGKKPMATSEVLRGYAIPQGTVLE